MSSHHHSHHIHLSSNPHLLLYHTSPYPLPSSCLGHLHIFSTFPPSAPSHFDHLPTSPTIPYLPTTLTLLPTPCLPKRASLSGAFPPQSILSAKSESLTGNKCATKIYTRCLQPVYPHSSRATSDMKGLTSAAAPETKRQQHQI